MRAYILSTGDELVRGRTQDTNTAEIARALADLGITVAGASLVGDSDRLATKRTHQPQNEESLGLAFYEYRQPAHCTSEWLPMKSVANRSKLLRPV